MIEKDKLLEINYFEENEYFDLYYNLILKNIKNKKCPGYNSHHIVPRHYYIHNNIDINNSKDNIVNLTIKDHMLAHMYLSGCTFGRDKYWNLYSVFLMSNKSIKDFNDIKNSLSCYEYLYNSAITSEYNHRKGSRISEETRNKMIKAQKLRVQLKGPTNKNYKWINNNIKDYMVKEEELEEYLSQGFSLGRLYRHSEETKNKIAQKSASWERNEEFCKKMSLIASKQIHTLEQNKKHSEWAKIHMVGEGNPFYGKHHTAESKEKNRQAHLGKIAVNFNNKVKMIKTEELDYYLSIGYKVGGHKRKNEKE